jgi:glycerol uptake facilitator-like aquaporin
MANRTTDRRVAVRRGNCCALGDLPYWAAQLAGSLLGVLLARVAWGPALARAPCVYSALRPAPGWSNVELFPAETASMAVIVLLVGVFLSVPRLAPRVPWLVGGLIGAAIAYLLAPLVGAVVTN